LQSGSSEDQGTVYFDDIVLTGDFWKPDPIRVTIGSSERKPVSPLIYGVNFASPDQLEIGYTVNRWGGNAETRYAWDIDTNNRAADWYFENIPNSVPSDSPYNNSADLFIYQTRQAKAQLLLTIPTIGWTPKTKEQGGSFEVSKYGPQQKVDPQHPNNGNGVDLEGKFIVNDPNDFNKPSTPTYAIAWLNHLYETFGNGSVPFAMLDNEPTLWSSTQRDIHPNPLSYDELWDITVNYASAIKAFDPSILTFGPVFYGWCAYNFSPKDGGCSDGPDRKAHGDLPFLEWYISQVANHRNQTGIQLVDVIDLHYYPEGVDYGTDESPSVANLRLRSPRAMWDPTYIEETWIASIIELIPRMRGYAEKFNLDVKLSISEYNYGDDSIITGALAQVDLLGIYAREGLYMACRWVAPTLNSKAEEAFKLFLNYDGNGAKIQGDYLLPLLSQNGDIDLSAHAYENDEALSVVLIAKNQEYSVPVTVDVSGILDTGVGIVYGFSKDKPLQPLGKVTLESGVFEVDLPSWSATLIVFHH